MEAGEIAKDSLEYGISLVDDGVSVLEIAEKVEKRILAKGAQVAFPANIGIDDVAAHFTPTHDERLALKRGQVVKVDIGAHIDGYIADCARTIEVSTNRNSDLILASSEALDAALSVARAGVKVRDVGGAIEDVIHSFGFEPIHNLTGHALKRYSLHAGLSIPNYRADSGALSDGDVVAIEPFATTGQGYVEGRIPGNIFRVNPNMKIEDDVVKKLSEIYKTLPFSERVCTRLTDKSRKFIKTMVKRRIFYSYPILKEIKGGIVSQCEDTLLITKEGCELITSS